jgi:hypothetical protein
MGRIRRTRGSRMPPNKALNPTVGRSQLNGKALIWNDPSTLIISSPDLF